MRMSYLFAAPAALGLLLVAGLPSNAANPPAPAATTTAPATTPAQTTTKPPAPTPGTPVNINTASLEELDALPGIGKARRAAIAGGRPYKDPHDLVTKGILSEGVYAKIKDRITVQ